mgnify:CR=1 FL=1
MVSSSFSQSTLSIQYLLAKGNIQITVKGDFSKSAEFYKGKYQGGADPIEKFKASSLLNCNSNGVCDLISFDSLKIYEPGDYYFVVRDVNQNPNRIDFVLNLENLLSCDYKGTVVRNNECVSKFTNNVNDKPLFCSNQKIIPRCAGPGFCGCPIQDLICCTNENLAECKGRLGECIKPGAEKLQKEVKVAEKTIVEKVGCAFAGASQIIPDNVCANMVVPGLLGDLKNAFFAGYCECTLKTEQELDKDRDGYDSSIFQGGSDCNDNNALINPGAIERCNPDVNNNNGVDENCDGSDLDCSASCDADGDGSRDNKRTFCKLIGGNDCNDFNAKVNPAAGEICDGVDNNCNGNIDENLQGCACTGKQFEQINLLKNSGETCVNEIDDNCNAEVDESICSCIPGDVRRTGLCKDGREACVKSVSGNIWEQQRIPSSSCEPSVFVNNAEGAINVNTNEEVTIKASFICSEKDGCGDVQISLG